MQSSSNPAFKNMDKVIAAQQQAAPSAEYLDQMYGQPAYEAPPRERFLTVDDVVTKTAVILVLAAVAGFAHRVVRAVLARAAGRADRVRHLDVHHLQAEDQPAADRRLRRRRGHLPRRHHRRVQPVLPGHRRPGDRRHHGRLRRHARRLQDRRHPGDPAPDQDDHRRHHRRCGADAVQPGDEPVRGQHGAARRRHHGDHLLRSSASRWRPSASCWTSTRSTRPSRRVRRRTPPGTSPSA